MLISLPGAIAWAGDRGTPDEPRAMAVKAADYLKQVGPRTADAGGTVTARVVRAAGGELAVVFIADARALASIDRTLDRLSARSRAA
jgi:hypothetical protein